MLQPKERTTCGMCRPTTKVAVCSEVLVGGPLELSARPPLPQQTCLSPMIKEDDFYFYSWSVAYFSSSVPCSPYTLFSQLLAVCIFGPDLPHVRWRSSSRSICCLSSLFSICQSSRIASVFFLFRHPFRLLSPPPQQPPDEKSIEWTRNGINSNKLAFISIMSTLASRDISGQ